MPKNKDDLTIKQWSELLEEYNYKCAYCGMSQKEHKKEHGQILHQDHVIPISKGGKLTKQNVVPCCQACNSSKGNRDVKKWLQGDYEKMKNYSFALYPSTHKVYLDAKEKLGLTHNEIMDKMIRSYREKEATNVHNHHQQ